MPDDPEVITEVLTEQQGADLFAEACRSILGVTAEDFLNAYDSGHAWDRWGHEDVARLVTLIPFARTREVGHSPGSPSSHGGDVSISTAINSTAPSGAN